VTSPSARSLGVPPVAFALGGLALHGVLSLLFLAVVVRAHDARQMDARWLLGPRPVEVMVAGDSHPRFAVEAPVLGSAINVAVPGEHYQKSLYRVPWLLDHGTRSVGAVVLPFDAASFASFKDDAYQPEAVWARYVDFDELGAHKGRRWAFALKRAKARAIPYLGELDTVLQWLTASRHFRDPGGASLLKVAFFEPGAMAARRHFEGADPWDEDMAWALRRLVDDLVGRGLRVVLVRFPVTRAYAVEAARLGAVPAPRDALATEMVRPGVVDHLDLEGAFFGQPALFGDGDHLNPIGKRRFSQLLASELRRIGVLTGTGALVP
jgi:hypothetical protein